MPVKATVTGTISQGEKKMTVNGEVITFTVPGVKNPDTGEMEDIKFTAEYEKLTDEDAITGDLVAEARKAINDARKGAARQNRYMLELAKYKPDTMKPEERLENAVRQLVLSGVPEELARQNVNSLRDSILKA